MQHVGADLRAEVDVLGLALLAGDLRLAFALLAFEQLGAQHRHRGRAIGGLRALVLALHHDPARPMGDAHRGVGLVDVLPAGAGGAVGVHLQIVVDDLDLAGLLHHRSDLDTREAGLAAVGGVERGEAYEPVHPALGAEQTVRVLPCSAEGGGLDARFLAGAGLQQLDREATRFRPAHLHAQHHLRPILRVGATGARVDAHQRVAGVVRAGEQPLLLERLQPHLGGGDVLLDLALQRLVLLRKLHQALEVLDVALERPEHLQPPRHPRVLGGDLPRALGVIPEARGFHLPLERARALCSAQPGQR